MGRIGGRREGLISLGARGIQRQLSTEHTVE